MLPKKVISRKHFNKALHKILNGWSSQVQSQSIKYKVIENSQIIIKKSQWTETLINIFN